MSASYAAVGEMYCQLAVLLLVKHHVSYTTLGEMYCQLAMLLLV
jgi:hypothetical protein